MCVMGEVQRRISSIAVGISEGSAARALRGIMHQGVHAAADRVAGSFLPAEDQQEAVEQNFDIAQAIAFNLAVDQRADQVLARVGPTLAYQCREVIENFHLRLGTGLLRGAINLVLGIFVADGHVGQVEHHVPIFARDREHLADDGGREFGGDVDDEIAFAAASYRIDYFGGDRADMRLERRERAGGEAAIHHLAHARMARRIDHDHHFAEAVLHRGQIGILRIGEANRDAALGARSSDRDRRQGHLRIS